MTGRFSGLRVVVTGGARGIGAASVARLRAEGAHVLALDLEPMAADPAGRTTPPAGVPDGTAPPAGVPDDTTPPAAVSGDSTGDAGSVTSGVVDVRDRAGVADAVEAWLDGRALDALVHAAGIGATQRTLDTTPEQWRTIVDVDLTGAFETITACLPALLRGPGAVVTVSSIAALAGRPYLAAYSAAKGGLVALTRALAVEYAGDGVRFNTVAPGSVDTALRDAMSPVPEGDRALLARGRAVLPQRVATPEDIAAAIAYLASPEARFVTGSVLVIDGGALA